MASPSTASACSFSIGILTARHWGRRSDEHQCWFRGTTAVREIGLAAGVGRAQVATSNCNSLLRLVESCCLGGAIGIIVSYVCGGSRKHIAVMGASVRGRVGRADIHLKISMFTLLVSTSVLLVVGVLSAIFQPRERQISIPSSFAI